MSAFLLASLLGGFAWLVLRPHELMYQGKPLSVWLHENYQRGGREWSRTQPEAERVVRAIGTNALPTLLQMVGTRLTVPRLMVAGFARDQTFAFLHLPPQDGRQEAALWALKLLGPDAKPAVPVLIRLLNQPDPLIAGNAATCLGGIGPAAGEAVPALVKAFNRSGLAGAQDENLRSASASALGDIGGAARSAVPLLAAATNELTAQLAVIKIQGSSYLPFIERLKDTSNRTNWSRTALLVSTLGTNSDAGIPLILAALQSTNSGIQTTAISTLGRIHGRPELCVPALIPLLKGTNIAVRRTSMGAIRAFGPAAKAAVPEIIRNLNDSDAWVQRQATNALREIDPMAAAKFGIK